MTERTLEEILHELQASQARREELERKWYYRWPSSGFTLIVLYAATAFFYVLSFTSDSTWLGAAVGTWFLSWPIAEDRRKAKAEARKKAWRAQWSGMEHDMMVWHTIRRVEYLITPEWML